jgi:hypothetical protein
MWKHLQALSLMVGLTAPFVAAAAEAGSPPPVPPLKFEASLKKIDLKVAKLLGDEKQQTLRQIAEAAVLSDYCAAINLDQAKFKQEFEALANDGANRKPAEQKDYDNKLSMYFGVYVGVLVAEGSDRRAEFCGFAENALKEQKPISRFWIATSSGATPPKP